LWPESAQRSQLANALMSLIAASHAMARINCQSFAEHIQYDGVGCAVLIRPNAVLLAMVLLQNDRPSWLTRCSIKSKPVPVDPIGTVAGGGGLSISAGTMSKCGGGQHVSPHVTCRSHGLAAERPGALPDFL